MTDPQPPEDEQRWGRLLAEAHNRIDTLTAELAEQKRIHDFDVAMAELRERIDILTAALRELIQWAEDTDYDYQLRVGVGPHVEDPAIAKARAALAPDDSE